LLCSFPPFELLASACGFWFNLYRGFWEASRPRFLRVLLSYLNALTNLSSHFFWKGWPHFLRGYYGSRLSWELGFCCPFHWLDILGMFFPFLLKATRANNLGSLSFQAHLRLTWELLPMQWWHCAIPFE
jgi:hypothetical protein